MFFTSGSQHARQEPHSLLLSGAGQLRLLVETVEVLAQLLTGPWSTIGDENRTTKFAGAASIWSLIQASRVGIQCLLFGVNLQTSKILFK